MSTSGPQRSAEYVVTKRRKVHARSCPHARRIAFPQDWWPEAKQLEDHACVMCLHGSLPDGSEASPLDEQCSHCGAAVGEDCAGAGDGYHLSRWDRLADNQEASDA